MYTSGQDPNKARKLKTIIAATIALVVILIVGVWAISAAISSTKKKEENSSAEVAVSNDQAKEEKPETTNPTGTGATSPADQYSATQNQAPAATVEAPVVQNNIPTTGPSEVIFSAVMVGVVVFLIGLNINLVKENRE